MKKTVTISMEVETWILAKERYTNLSERIETLLRADLQEEETPKTLDEMREALKRRTAVLEAMKADLSKAEEIERERASKKVVIE